jgi:hypothetical protein
MSRFKLKIEKFDKKNKNTETFFLFPATFKKHPFPKTRFFRFRFDF